MGEYLKKFQQSFNVRNEFENHDPITTLIFWPPQEVESHFNRFG